MISIIVPVYNVEQYLNECVRSITEQTYSDLEIILVDDGSTDGSGAVCDAWAEKDARIRVVHKENGGLSDARNAGLDICRGEYIAFADSDDILDEKMLEQMLHAMEREDTDICGCGIAAFDGSSEVTCRIGGRGYVKGRSEVFLRLLYDDTNFPVSSCGKLYRKKLWDTIRFPKGKICEDAFTTCRLIHAADRIVYTPECLYRYRLRPGSIMTSEFTERRMDEEEAWRENCGFISENYPELYDAVYTFYLQKVRILICEIGEENKEEFREEYEYLRKILKEGIMFMLFHSTASFKYRLSYLADAIRL